METGPATTYPVFVEKGAASVDPPVVASSRAAAVVGTQVVQAMLLGRLGPEALLPKSDQPVHLEVLLPPKYDDRNRVWNSTAQHSE